MNHLMGYCYRLLGAGGLRDRIILLYLLYIRHFWIFLIHFMI